VFRINGIDYMMSGQFSFNIKSFKVPLAKLEYGDEEQLASKRELSGKIGPRSASLILHNGTKISGDISDHTNSAVDVVEQEHGCKFDPSFPTVLE
jgi:hypothetical protein